MIDCVYFLNIVIDEWKRLFLLHSYDFYQQSHVSKQHSTLPKGTSRLPIQQDFWNEFYEILRTWFPN